jgi:hypothetical protein
MGSFLIISFFIVVGIVFVITLPWALIKARLLSLPYYGILGVFYIALIVVGHEQVDAGIYASNNNVGGGTVGWFAPNGVLVFCLLVLMITGVQIAIIIYTRYINRR